MLQNLVHPLIADAIAVVIAFSVFFFVLHKRAIGIVCPHCHQYLETNTPWICGFKQCRNEQVDDFPFIYRCQHCGAEPKAYQCHHCGELIFFTKDQQRINYAVCVNIPVEAKDEDAEEVLKKNRDIQLAELDVKKAKYDVELKGYKKELEKEDPKPKSVEEKYRAALKNEDDEIRLRAEIDEEFKDNDDERKRRHLIVDGIMRGSI